MPSCDICGKELSTKAGLSKHKTKKIPCKPPTKLIDAALDAAGVKPISEEFRENSLKMNKELSKEIRSNEGIYFTPKKVRDLLFENVNKICKKSDIKNILEPSFGTGEFMKDARHVFPDATIWGVEKNKKLFDSFIDDGCTTKFRTEESDFLKWTSDTEFDLIIGNPPYFVMKEHNELSDACMSGRPNIFVLFLYKCITCHLKKNGVLAFIIPTSLYNCSYYQKMRDYIVKNTTIKYVETLDKPGFYQTNQETMLLIIQKKKGNSDYIFKGVNGLNYISPYWKELNKLVSGSTTLDALGMKVKTGNIVWNQMKDNLTNDKEKGVLLVYSSNIKDSVLVLDNLKGDEKKQYITDIKKEPLKCRTILVERGYGNTFRFNAIIMSGETAYYAENHLNVIYGSDENIDRVYTSLKDKRTCEFVKLFLANGSMSASDLEQLIPIY